MNVERTKITTSTRARKTPTLLKTLLTRVQATIPMEAAAETSGEAGGREAAMGEGGQLAERKDVSLANESTRGHPSARAPRSSGQTQTSGAKKAHGGRKRFVGITAWRGAPDPWRDEHVAPGASQEAKMTQPKPSYVAHMMRRQVPGRDNHSGKQKTAGREGTTRDRDRLHPRSRRPSPQG